MIDLRTKRITVFGGFLGKHLVRKLAEKGGCRNIFVADLPDYDLMTDICFSCWRRCRGTSAPTVRIRTDFVIAI